jgi:hypothetical protein
MADTVTVVPGKRTISRVPTAPIDQRREGRIDHDQHRDKIWRGGTVGEVVDQMNSDLGKVHDDSYDVTE